MWFNITIEPSCLSGPNHLHKCIQLSRYLDDDLKSVIDPVIQRNAYFAHPENILLAMMKDKNKNIRELAVRRIIKARNQNKAQPIRKFVIPPLNFEASKYYELIDWQMSQIFEPPVLIKYSQEELWQHAVDISSCLLDDFRKIPCHTLLKQ